MQTGITSGLSAIDMGRMANEKACLRSGDGQGSAAQDEESFEPVEYRWHSVSRSGIHPTRGGGGRKRRRRDPCISISGFETSCGGRREGLE